MFLFYSNLIEVDGNILCIKEESTLKLFPKSTFEAGVFVKGKKRKGDSEVTEM